MKNALGKHTLLEFYDCDSGILNDAELLEKHFLKAAELSGATIIESKFHTFSPYGVSGVIVIAESHFTIHTWPEHCYAAVDIFTCGDLINSEFVQKYLEKNLHVGKVEVKEFRRGFVDAEGEVETKPAALLRNQTA